MSPCADGRKVTVHKDKKSLRALIFFFFETIYGAIRKFLDWEFGIGEELEYVVNTIFFIELK